MPLNIPTAYQTLGCNVHKRLREEEKNSTVYKFTAFVHLDANAE